MSGPPPQSLFSAGCAATGHSCTSSLLSRHFGVWRQTVRGVKTTWRNGWHVIWTVRSDVWWLEIARGPSKQIDETAWHVFSPSLSSICSRLILKARRKLCVRTVKTTRRSNMERYLHAPRRFVGPGHLAQRRRRVPARLPRKSGPSCTKIHQIVPLLWNFYFVASRNDVFYTHFTMMWVSWVGGKSSVSC